MHRAHKHVLGVLVGGALGSTSMGRFTEATASHNTTAFGLPVDLFALLLIGGFIGAVFALVALAGVYGVLRDTVLADGETTFDPQLNPVPFLVLCVMVALVGWFAYTALGDMSLLGNIDVPFVDQAFND